jgi:hypothetical protein
MKNSENKSRITIEDLFSFLQLYSPCSIDKSRNRLLTQLNIEIKTTKYLQTKQNIKFLICIANAVLSIKHEATYEFFRLLLLDYIKKHYDENSSFNWQDLKSILFFCLYMKNIKSQKELEQKTKSSIFQDSLYNYLMKDNCLEKSKKLYLQYLSKKSNCKQLRLNF